MGIGPRLLKEVSHFTIVSTHTYEPWSKRERIEKMSRNSDTDQCPILSMGQEPSSACIPVPGSVFVRSYFCLRARDPTRLSTDVIAEHGTIH